VRVNSKVPLIVPTPHLHHLPLSQEERRQSPQELARFRSYGAGRGPNILWSRPSETPSNCVIFRL